MKPASSAIGARVTPSRVALLAPVVAVPVWFLAHGNVRWEHVAILIVVPALAFGGPRLERLFFGVYPLLAVGVLYDTMGVVKNVGVTPARVHVCDLHALDTLLFGIPSATGKIAPSDWLQAHATPALDLFCAIPYGTFLFVCVAFAIFAFRRDVVAMKRFGWGFFLLNVLGFATYHVLPAAPPWYFHTHGCAVDVFARASEGPNLARVDAILGAGYFRGMYGRSNDVFGAIPSLHVAYPLLIVLEGRAVFDRGWRAASVAFFLSMCFAAVYLDHHWVIDVLVGLGYALLVDVAVRRIFPRAAASAAEAMAVGEGAPS